MFLTANERFKEGNYGLSALAVTASTILHYALFEYFPPLEAAQLGSAAEEVRIMALPPEVRIPPPPHRIARPAKPVVATAADLREDVTIAPTTFEHHPVESLPQPPSKEVDVRERPVYVARDVEPRLKNSAEIRILLTRLYPPMLREAGVGGTTILWVFVETDGRAGACQVHRSSGYAALDETAEQVASYMVFSPALNRDRPVGVWVAQPIEFRIKPDERSG